jgi:hypothetical protein
LKSILEAKIKKVNFSLAIIGGGIMGCKEDEK